MTKDQHFQKAVDCLNKAENHAADEVRASIYLRTAELWIKLAQAE